jgi:cell division protein FtsQ
MNAAASWLLASVIVVLLAAGAWWALRNPVFAVRGITVTGDTEHNSSAALRAAVAERVKGNFFTLDLNDVRRAVETLPWVRTAVVQREFPDRLSVRLLEHVPVARWGDKSGQLLGQSGDVFPMGGSDAGADLPLLEGPDGQAPLVLEVYRDLVPMTRTLDTTVAGLELQPRGHWTLTLASGGRIELGQGSPAELTARFDRFAETVGTVAARHGRTAADIESADLRYQQGYAVRLHGVNTVSATSPGTKPSK